MNWKRRMRGGEVVESVLEFGRRELVVHRHRDDEHRWVWSCHRLRYEDQPVGISGTPIETAERMAISDLKSQLKGAIIALREATK